MSLKIPKLQLDKVDDYKLIMFNTVDKLIDACNSNNNLKKQLDNLMKECFPKYFPLGGSFIENMQSMLNKKLINSSTISTLLVVKISSTPTPKDTTLKQKPIFSDKIVGCVQLIKDSNECKLINLCRKNHSSYRGLGSYILNCAIDYIRNYTKYRVIKLSVRANNTKLQQYYQTLGWTHTYNYDDSNVDEPAFEMIYFL